MTLNLIKHTQRGLAAIALAVLAVGAAHAESDSAIEVIIASWQAEPAPAAQAAEPLTPANPAQVAQAEAPVDPPAPLGLVAAIELALASHPGLCALDKEYQALDNLAWQEGRRPNPSLEVEFEEFGGTDDTAGFRNMATSLTYTQPIERGGKRHKRVTAASLEREVLLWDITQLEFEIQANVRGAYNAVQAAQYDLMQLGMFRELAERIYDTVSAGVEAGRNARLELERLEIELALLDQEIAAARRSLGQARLELAATWGATTVDFNEVTPLMDTPPAVPALANLERLLDNHPALARFDAEYEALCAALDLENANAVTDLEVSGGITQAHENGEFIFKVGVGFDLQVNDRNEGNISAAGYRLEQVADNREAARLEMASELAVLHGQALNALANYESYTGRLLPAAQKVLDLTEEGYHYGKFELLDVLDTQRTVLELEAEQAAALVELSSHLTEIEALLNTDLAVLERAGQTTEEHDHE